MKSRDVTMGHPMRTGAVVALALAVGAAVTILAQRGTPPTAASASASNEATRRIVAAAQAVLAILDDSGRTKVHFPFEGPQKTKWSNLPSGIFQREGLRMSDLA